MKRDQIITAARELFMKYGFRSVSMDDVCRAIGISKKTLYEHIDTKDRLIELTLDSHLEDEEKMLNEIEADTDDALDIMFRISHFIVELVRQTNPRVSYDLNKYYHHIYQKWEKEHGMRIYERLKVNLESGQKQGYYRENMNNEIVARLYAGKVRMIFDESMFPTSEFDQATVVREHFIYHLHGILTPKGLKKLNEQDLLNKITTA